MNELFLARIFAYSLLPLLLATAHILLIGLSWWSARRFGGEMNTAVFQQWQMPQQPIAGLAAAGIGMGFGLGYAVGGLFVWTLIGALAGVGIGLVMSRRAGQATSGLVLEQQ